MNTFELTDTWHWLRGPDATINVVRTVADVADLSWWMAERADVMLGIDSETNAVDPFADGYRLRLVQIADERTSWVLVVDDLPDGTIARVVSAHRHWLAHFAEADLRFIERGAPGSFRIDDPLTAHLSDLQVLLAYYDPRTVLPAGKDGTDVRLAHAKGLKDTATRELSPVLAEVEKRMHARFVELAPKGHRTAERSKVWGFANIADDDEVYLTYAGLDPLFTIRLWQKMLPVVERRGQRGQVFADLALQWQIDLMTFRGQEVDPVYVRWLAGQLDDLIERNTVALADHGIAPSAQGASVAWAMGRLQVESPKTTNSGKPSFDKTVIKTLARRDDEVGELARTIEASRKAGKFRSTYVAPMLAALERDGKVHPSMRAVGTVTGRMSAARPPVQQLPKKDTRVRAAFRAPEGWSLISCDFSQGEPRVMAGLSGDRVFTETVLAGDINSDTAAVAYGDDYDPADGKHAGTESYLMRQRAKAAFLAWCYGASPNRVASTLELPADYGRTVVKFWRKQYPVLTAFARKLNAGNAVTLASGRICPLWDRYRVVEGDKARPVARPSRLGLNYITQGTQRDLLAFAVFRLSTYRGWGAHLWTLIHDEILLLVPDDQVDKAMADLQWSMSMPFHGVPIEAEAELLGRTWMPQPEELALAELDVVDSQEH